MNAKKVLLILVVVMIVLGGLTVGLMFKIQSGLEQTKEDNFLTTTLPKEIRLAIESKNIHHLQYTVVDNQPVDFSNYLYLTIGNVQHGQNFYFFRYDSFMNQLLNTVYDPEKEYDGIILETTGYETTGHYESKTRRRNAEAQKPYYVLTCVSIPDQEILRRDTVWGGEPPATISKTESAGIGKYPTPEERAKIVRQITKGK